MPLRNLISDATLALLASHTPPPVPTYELPPLGVEVAHSPERVARANGIDLTYDTFGDPQNPPILLVMGLSGQMIAWNDEFCARLAARGFYVIRFDNRDIGRSTWLDHEPVPNLFALTRALRRGEPVRVPYGIGDMADDALGLLDALGIERAHVVGISMGGMIAQAMAIASPHRVRTLTSIMSHTAERDLPHPHRRVMGVMMIPAPRERDAYLKHSIQVWRILNGPVYAVDLARIHAESMMIYQRGRHPAGSGRQLAAILAAPSRLAGLRSLAVPTLVMHGDRDPLIPLEGGRRTAAAIPGAALEIIPGMGHALPPPLWERIIGRIAAHAERNG